MREIVLLAPWGRFVEPGVVLEVLGPKDDLGPHRVDQVRAETLVRDGLAEWVVPGAPAAAPEPPAEAAAAPKRRRKKAED